MRRRSTILFLANVILSLTVTGTDALPYEFAWARRTRDEHLPLLAMTNADGWRVEAANSEVRLVEATDRQLFGPGVLRVVHRATGPNPTFRLLCERPVPVPAFDAVSLWIYGNNHQYVKDPQTPPVTIVADFVDAQDKPFSVWIDCVRHLEWNLAYRKLKPEILVRAKAGVRFVGFTFKGGSNVSERSVDLTSFCAFCERLPSLDLALRPKRPNRVFPKAPCGINGGKGMLPFPTVQTTVIPLVGKRSKWRFRLPVDPLKWDDLSVSRDGQVWQAIAAGGGVRLLDESAVWSGLAKTNSVSPLDVEYVGAVGTVPTSVRFHVVSQSMVVDVQVAAGIVDRVTFGGWPSAPGLRLQQIPVPYYTYNRRGKTNECRPTVLLAETSGGSFFHAATLDWTQSNASWAYGAETTESGCLAANGGVEYRTLTDGRRNPCYERFVYSFGEDFVDVLPTIPNPPSPWKDVTGSNVWMSYGVRDRAADLDFWRSVRARGLSHVLVVDHETCWRDGNESFTYRTSAAPGKGGDRGQLAYSKAMIEELGYRYGLYNNFADFAPVNEFWKSSYAARAGSGQLIPAWERCYLAKCWYAVDACARLSPIVARKFKPNAGYCDIHTQATPWSHCDYDARVPGGGTFANTFYAYGEIMLLQKTAWRGPVYSEGGMHYLYCGLADGSYAQDQEYDLSKNPWLVDFDLLVMHPLCCNFGMGNLTMFFPRGVPADRAMAVDRFLAATAAFGHPGILFRSEGDMYRSYFMIQQLAAHYTAAQAEKIRYLDADGRSWTTSEALRNGAVGRSQVVVRYSDGTFVAANGSMSEPMDIRLRDTILRLPPNGYFGRTMDGRVLVYSGNWDGRRIDLSYSPEYVYADTRGSKTVLPGLTTNGIVRCFPPTPLFSALRIPSLEELARKSK